MSKFSGKCNEISIIEWKLFEEIKDYYVDALNDAADKLLDLIRDEISKTVWGKGPGKPEWRKDLIEKMKVVHREIADNYLEAGVGVPEPSSLGDLLKAMVIAYGAGSAVGRKPITAGPTGRMVWDENLDEKQKSKAQAVYELPEEFNQEGNHFIQNSVKLMKKHFNDVLNEASENIPDRIFYQNVQVKPR